MAAFLSKKPHLSVDDRGIHTRAYEASAMAGTLGTFISTKLFGEVDSLHDALNCVRRQAALKKELLEI